MPIDQPPNPFSVLQSTTEFYTIQQSPISLTIGYNLATISAAGVVSVDWNAVEKAADEPNGSFAYGQLPICFASWIVQFYHEQPTEVVRYACLHCHWRISAYM